MKKPDVNLLSFNGDLAGNVWLNGVKIFDASEPGIRVYTIEGDVDANPSQYADAVKFSGVRRLHVIVTGIIYGGAEDCVDVNNKCYQVTLVALGGFRARGNFVGTIKGGSKQITIRGEVLSHGTEVDFDFGNHSDQSDDETQGIFLDVWAEFTVTWRQLNASDVTLRVGSRFRAVLRLRGGFWRSLFAKLYAIYAKLRG